MDRIKIKKEAYQQLRKAIRELELYARRAENDRQYKCGMQFNQFSFDRKNISTNSHN